MGKDVKPYGMFSYFFNSDKRKKEKLYKQIVDTLVKNGVTNHSPHIVHNCKVFVLTMQDIDNKMVYDERTRRKEQIINPITDPITEPITNQTEHQINRLMLFIFPKYEIENRTSNLKNKSIK